MCQSYRLKFKPVCWWLVIMIVQVELVVEAAHFRGASIQWSPVYFDDNNMTTQFSGAIQISHHISWTRTSNEGGDCDRTVISLRRLLGQGLGQLSCRAGCKGVIGTMDYHCTDFSEEEDWSVGRRSYLYEANKVEYFVASYLSGDWTALVIGGGEWEIRVTVNLTRREDTGQINSSPVTALFGEVHLQHGCNQTVKIPVFDVDGDTIRCRWATGNECGGICHQQSSPFQLSPDTCTLTYGGNGQEGIYAMALQIEDFASTNDFGPLSSVPLQFLVFVFALPGVSCGTLINFVGETPADGTCIAVPQQSVYSSRIVARSIGRNSIVDIETTSPLGFLKSRLMKGSHPQDWFVDVTWRPDDSNTGPNILCYSALDNVGTSSPQSCITLLVGVAVESPALIPESLAPRGLINRTNPIQWTANFDIPFQRPSYSAFIRILSQDGTEVVTIDVSISEQVFYPQTNTSLQLVFQTQYNFAEGETYHVVMDSGVVLSKGMCGAKSPANINSGQWNVSIIVPDPCISNPCDINADCLREGLLSEVFTCTCRHPFQGTGFNCLIPDPCLSEPCNENALCEREGLLNSNFTCTCQMPYSGDGFNCSFPDPCISNPCDINADCLREGLLSEVFTCTCRRPFQGTGFNCLTPDPCISDPCDVNAKCTREGLISSVFTCLCGESFTGDGFNCSEVQQNVPHTGIVITVPTVIAILVFIILVGAIYGYYAIFKEVKKTRDKTLLT